MMKLELDADLCILQAVGSDEPERADCTYALYDGPISWSEPHPSCRLRFLNGAAVWEDSATLDQIKGRKRDEINAAYRLANDTSFTFAGKEIQADAHAMKQITITHGGIVGRGALKAGWSGYWKALDNSYVAIPDLAAWWQFYDAIEATGQANFNKAQNLKAQIDAATTAAEVAVIQWHQPAEAA